MTESNAYPTGAIKPPADLQNTFASICWGLGKSVGKIPLAGDIVNWSCGRQEAVWRYKELHPLLMESLRRSGPDDKMTVFLASEIAKTANWGAKRKNFIDWYVTGRKLRELPLDPKEIMFGYW